MGLDVVDLTERLVGVDTSPGCSTGPLLDVIVERARRLDAQVRVQDGQHAGVPQQNLVLRFGGDGPAGLVLAGHLDTVPWESGQRATLQPERDGRRLFGRGTCDMKGALAACLLAAAERRESLRRPLVLLFTYAEELGCHGADALMGQSALLGDTSEAVCLVGEPTDLAPITGHKGYAGAVLHLEGTPAHSSDPWAGADASVSLGTLLRDLHELREALRREGDPGCGHVPPCTTLNTGLVRAGSARNVVPAHASVQLELRPLPGQDERALQARIAACVELAVAASPGVRGWIEWQENRPPFDQPAAEIVSWLEARTGRRRGVVPFYTEAELYRRGLGVPTVVCGPGSIAQAHRIDESISFDQLEAGQQLYADAIAAFCC